MSKVVEGMSDLELVGVLVGASHAGEMLQDAGSLTALLGEEITPYARRKRLHIRLAAAKELVRRSLMERIIGGTPLSSPAAVREYLRLTLGGLPHEVFMVIYLDAQNRVLKAEELFRGTLTQTSVYPREVVKRSLHFNAGAVILAHNHPSGLAEPSHADETLTQALKQALALVDVRVLDHFVVGMAGVISFAERGLL